MLQMMVFEKLREKEKVLVWQIALFELHFTLSQTSLGFYMFAVQVILKKTPWEKEKLLVTSNFSFSHCVFKPFREVSAIFINMKFSSANSFSLEESKICCLGKG